MSSTNKTTYYELSQFVGTDKPAWLSDYNGDMNKIDTAIYNASSTASGADGKADANATSIGTLADLTTDAKTSAVAAINEVDSHADTAQNTANSASTSANTALAGLQRFNLTEKSTLSPSTTKGTIDTSVSNIQFATDTTSAIFKIYGRVFIRNLSSASGSMVITLGQTSLRPTSAYTINTGAFACRVFDGGTTTDTVPRNLVVNTDGSITVTDTLVAGITDYNLMLPPCLYFNTDFGDE